MPTQACDWFTEPVADDDTPSPPAELERWILGPDTDAQVTPDGPGLLMMGGGVDLNEGFEWMSERMLGGDMVVLRTSGTDGYNPYLFDSIGGFDSVHTLMVTSRDLAQDPFVAHTIDTAEGVFLSGGDQATYVNNWKDTAVHTAIEDLWERGGLVGGTSAGLAVMGEHTFAAYNGTVYSDEVLEDPYHGAVQLDTFLSLPVMSGMITDSHFAQRDRMGRLLGFTARILTDSGSTEVLGLGVDETTGVVVESDGTATVIGEGHVYLVVPDGTPTVCEAGEPLQTQATVHALSAGDQLHLPSGSTDVAGYAINAAGGALNPSDPY